MRARAPENTRIHTTPHGVRTQTRALTQRHAHLCIHTVTAHTQMHRCPHCDARAPATLLLPVPLASCASRILIFHIHTGLDRRRGARYCPAPK